MPQLPARPSAEHLRKQAKRLARASATQLAEAQRLLANDYGFRTWADLMRHVATASGDGDAATVLVAAVRNGDVEAVRDALAAGGNPRVWVDGEPRLLRERIVGPEVYRRRPRADYFRDPMLFWFVANNPTTVARMAPNIVDVARVMIERGVDSADFDYTLGLVMTSSVAREEGHQLPLMRALLAAGANATRANVVVAAAHRELEGLRALVAAGHPLDAPLAGAFGDVAALRSFLPAASREDVALAFGLAVINEHVEAARLALSFGAEVDAFLPVHSHGTALHQAAATNSVPLIEMLLEAGARQNIQDTLWDGTPLGWARFSGHAEAVAALSKE